MGKILKFKNRTEIFLDQADILKGVVTIPAGTYNVADVIGRLALDIAAKANLNIPQNVVEVHPENDGWRVIAKKNI